MCASTSWHVLSACVRDRDWECVCANIISVRIPTYTVYFRKKVFFIFPTIITLFLGKGYARALIGGLARTLRTAQRMVAEEGR